jgi:hypothetical protein
MEERDMRSDRSVRAALTILGLVAAAGMTAPAHAQYVAELTPFFTSYYPLTKIDFEGSTSDFYAKQKIAPGVGARLTFWFSNTVGFEAAGSYVFSSPAVFLPTDAGPATLDLAGTLITGTGRLVFRPSRTNLYLVAGGGIVSRGGDAWESDESETLDFAGVLGIGARANVTPKFAINVLVEGTFYSLDPDGSPEDPSFDFFTSSLQSDITVSIGIPIGFGRR